MKYKSKDPVKVCLPRRSKRKRCAKQLAAAEKPFVYRRRSKSTTNIQQLPIEVLCKIFSHLTVQQLFYQIRPVCHRWRKIAMTPELWTKIEVQNDVSTPLLSAWLKSSFLLKDLAMENRNDANVLTELVSKHCKKLERIKVFNCWGSKNNKYVHSGPLCHLVTRCHKLYHFNFAHTRFSSCKFFRLISKDKLTGKIMKKCNYFGPMNAKQMKALLVALTEYDVNDSATIGNGTIKQKFKLREVVRYVEEIQFQSSMVDDVWANLHYMQNVDVGDPANVPVELNI